MKTTTSKLTTITLLCCLLVALAIGAGRIRDMAEKLTLADTNAFEVAESGVGSYRVSYGSIATNLAARIKLPYGTRTRLVFEGDSLTWLGQPTNQSWSVWLTNRFFTDPLFTWGTNAAESGETTTTMLSQYTDQIQPFKPAGGTNAILFLRGGVVDLYYGTNTAAQMYASLSNEWFLARQDGFRVCAFTVTDPGYTLGARDGLRIALNEAIQNSTNQWDWCVDLSAMFPNNDPVVTYDGLHFTYKANYRIAQAVAAVLFGGPQPTAVSERLRFNTMTFSGNVTNNGVHYLSYTAGGAQFPGRGGLTAEADGSFRFFSSSGGGNPILQLGVNSLFGPGLVRVGAGVAITGGAGVYSSTNNLIVSGSASVTNGVTSPAINLPGGLGAPSFTSGFGGHLWSDGTNLCVVLENTAGGRTTNKMTLSAWP